MDWQPIGTEVQLLTANQQRIKDMLDAGKGILSICGVMRMRREHVIDEIYEIRKKEAIMSKQPVSGKLSPQQKVAIYEAYKNGEKQQVLAKQYGVCNQAISYTIKKMREAEESMAAAVNLPAAAQVPEPEPEQKPAVINPEFDAAVDEMIAESKSADAEENAANAEKKSVFAEVSEPVQDPTPELEDVENGIPNTPLVSEKSISPVIRRLVTYGISDMESEIEEREQQIAELKMEIEEFRKDIEIAKAWKEKQKWK